MLSRVANSVFWMARYIERAENTARFVDVVEHMALGLGEDRGQAEWEALIRATGDEDAFRSAYDDTTRDRVAHFLLLDDDNPNSVISCVAAARENARTIRESITSEMWSEINRLYHALRALPPLTDGVDTERVMRVCRIVKSGSLAFEGTAISTLARNLSYDFLRLGCLVERADKTSRLLDVKYFVLLPSVEHVGSPLDQMLWASLLRSVSALEMYRQRYGSILPANVLRLLVLDAEVPRSLRFCLTEAQVALDHIARKVPAASEKPARRLGRLRSELVYGTVDDIKDEGVHEFLDRFQIELNTLGLELTEAYFNPAAPEPLPAGTAMQKQSQS